MSVAITMPKLGVEMEVAVFSEWIVAEGAEVAEGDVIAHVETDKVIFELPSPAAGVLHRIAEEGTEYPIGETLGELAGVQGDGGTVDPDEPGREHAAVSPAEAATAAASGVAPPPGAGTGAQADGIKELSRSDGDVRPEILASPLARRIAADRGVELSAITGSGPRGAIRRVDVERVAAEVGNAEVQVADAEAAGKTRSPASVQPSDRSQPTPPSSTIDRLSPMRRTIAQRMYQSLHSTAQLTDIREHDVTAFVALREDAVSKAEHLRFKLSYSTLFARATLMALRVVPELNAQMLSDNEVQRFDHVGLGTAVAVADGLLVPVVHDADLLGLRELNESLATVIERARTRTASADDLSGGTFTITNFGSYGSHIGTPILMPPQVAILGIGATIERPVVRAGEIAVGKVMYTSLTVDHRVIDGETAGRFQTELGRLLAVPDLLLYG